MKTPVDASRHAHLQTLLLDGRKYECEWGHDIPGKPGLSNHLPMALIALYRLGASKEELDTFFHSYVPKLRPLEAASNGITAENYKNHLGTHRENGSWIHFFRVEAESRGLSEVLKVYLPELMPGVAAAALHPIIRLGYALDIGSEEEAIHALAAWGYSYIPLAIAGAPKGKHSPEQVLEAMQNSPTLSNQPTPDGLITEQLLECSARVSFQETVNQANPETLHLGDLARLVRLFYLASGGDFTALHCVTSLHAYRNLLPYLNERDATQSLWPVLCAAYISRGTPNLRKIEPVEGPGWDDVVARCIDSNDSHAIKATYTGLMEGEYYGETNAYLSVARMESHRAS
jgi:hypothetical protein